MTLASHLLLFLGLIQNSTTVDMPYTPQAAACVVCLCVCVCDWGQMERKIAVEGEMERDETNHWPAHLVSSVEQKE